MTDQRINGGFLSEKKMDSPLTVGDLLAVLNSIFGKGMIVSLSYLDHQSRP